MKTALSVIVMIVSAAVVQAQNFKPTEAQQKDIRASIDQYSQAREKRDTVLLKSILTAEVDQLVSTGEWRDGVQASMKGMFNSSAGSPGTRMLTVKKLRMIDRNSAIVDCEYTISNPNATMRKMWSTFVVTSDKNTWKISAIRNMLPAAQ